MKIHSEYTPKEYIHHMRCHMSAHSDFGRERFTGFFAGRFFYVTRHSDFEWNRKVTNQKSAALGYVKQAEDGCQVRYIRFRGQLCPLEFLKWFLIISVVAFLSLCLKVPELVQYSLLFSLIVTVLTALITTLAECLTADGDEGRRILLSFLKDPADPYKNLPYIP